MKLKVVFVYIYKNEILSGYLRTDIREAAKSCCAFTKTQFLTDGLTAAAKVVVVKNAVR